MADDFEIPELNERDILSVGPIPGGVITEDPQMIGIPELREEDIISVSPPPVRQVAKKRPIRRKKAKPSQPLEKQEFYGKPPLGEIGAAPGFKFETTPFRTTDLERANLAHPELPRMRGATEAEQDLSRRSSEEVARQRAMGPGAYSTVVKGGVNLASKIARLKAGVFRTIGRDDWAEQELSEIRDAENLMSSVDQEGARQNFIDKNIAPQLLPVGVESYLLRRAPLGPTLGVTSGLETYGVSNDPIQSLRAGVTGGVTGFAMRGAQALPNMAARIAGGGVAGTVPTISRYMQDQPFNAENTIGEIGLGALSGVGGRRPLPVPRLGQYTNPYLPEPNLLPPASRGAINPATGEVVPPMTSPSTRAPSPSSAPVLRLGQGVEGKAPLEGPILPFPPPRTSASIRGPVTEKGGRPDRIEDFGSGYTPEELIPTPEEADARIQEAYEKGIIKTKGGQEKIYRSGKGRRYYTPPPGVPEIDPLADWRESLTKTSMEGTDPETGLPLSTNNIKLKGFESIDAMTQDGTITEQMGQYLKGTSFEMLMRAEQLANASIDAKDPIQKKELLGQGLELLEQANSLTNAITKAGFDDPFGMQIVEQRTPGKAISLILPRTIYENTLGLRGSSGLTTASELYGYINQEINSPTSPFSRAEKQQLIGKVVEYIDKVKQAGQNSYVLINGRVPDYIKYGKILPHESTHAGQYEMLEHIREKIQSSILKNVREPKDLQDLADPDWINRHPVLSRVIEGPFGKSISSSRGDLTPADLVGVEAPAYFLGGDVARMFSSYEEGLNTTFDLFDHLMDRWGPDILDRLEATYVPASEELGNVIPQAKERYAARQQGRDDELTSVMEALPGPTESGDGPPTDIAAASATRLAEPRELGGVFESKLPSGAKQFSVKGYTGKVTLLGPGDYPGTAKVKFVDTGLEEEFDIKELRGARGGRTVKDPIIDMIKKNPPAAFEDQGLRQKRGEGAKGVPLYQSGQYAKLMPGGIRVTIMRPAANTLGMSVVQGPTGAELTVRNVDLEQWGNIPLVTEGGTPVGPPTDPPDPSAPDPSLPDLMTTVVKSEHNKSLAEKFINLMDESGLEYNPAIPPGMQVYQAVLQGDLRDDVIDEILKNENITWEEFANEVLYTYSEAGRTLQTLSTIDQEAWRRLEEQNPDLLNKIMPPHIRVGMILKDLERTELGRNLWKRIGGVAQKAVLTQMATFAVNTGTTLNKIPLDMATSALGVYAQGLKEGKGSFKKRMKDAHEDVQEIWKAYTEIFKALNPKQIKELFNNFKKTRSIGESTIYAKHKQVVGMLERFHPEIHSKLFARPMQDYTIKMGNIGKQIDLAEKQLLPRIKDKNKRRDYQNQLATMRRRYDREFEKKMKLVKGPEIAYDFLLQPLQFSEFLFRRPMFVMWLNIELRNQGIDLKKVISNTNKYEGKRMSPAEWKALSPDERMTFKKIPEDVIKSALNKALELTYAYDPEDVKSAPIMERAASHAIDAIAWMGPLLPLGEMFPRAMYNGAMALYNYGPLPFIFMGDSKSPINRALFPKFDVDPKTQEKYRTNPASLADWERVGKALGGSVLYMALFALKRMIGDDQANWYEIPIPFTKNDKGQRKYIDIRSYKPISEMYHLVDLVDRIATGRFDAHKLGDELLEIYTGMKRVDASPDTFDILNAVADMWAGEDTNARVEAAKVGAGRDMSIYLTPFINLRDMYAQFDDEQNKARDLRGTGFMGPFIDKLPWFSKSLPAARSPLYPGELPISEAPALKLAGIKLQSQQNYMGQEFARMGINIRDYLGKDPDPVIDREQSRLFEMLGNNIGAGLAQDPSYVDASDDMKMARWEQYLIGDDGIVAMAKEFARNANMNEEQRREIKKQFPGPYTRKAFGIERILESLRSR